MDKPKDRVIKEGQLDVEYDLCCDLDVMKNDGKESALFLDQLQEV